MIQINEAIIGKIICHRVCNDELKSIISDDTIAIANSDDGKIFTEILLKPFQNSEMVYEFYHEIDLNLNVIYNIAQDIYNGEEFVKCSKSEYKVDRIKYNKDTSIYNYTFDNGIYKTIEDNSKLKQLIHNSEIKIEKENRNKIYYVLDDNFYMYTPENGSEIIFYNYELSFNNKNTIFVYVDN